jgi:hypothetical protein
MACMTATFKAYGKAKNISKSNEHKKHTYDSSKSSNSE